MKKENQVPVRLVWAFGRFVDRKYAQSTSGLRDSQLTAPLLSLSSAMTSDSRSSCFTEAALRKYPMDVPQRRAKSSCESRSSDFKYRSNSSMLRILPDGNVPSSPVVHLPIGNNPYDGRMDVMQRIKKNRQQRMGQLLGRYASQEELAAALGVEQNYVSRTASGKKPIGEKAARNVEQSLGLDDLWMDTDPNTPQRAPWPFSFHRSRWDRLSAKHREELEVAVLRLLGGIEAEMVTKKKTG